MAASLTLPSVTAMWPAGTAEASVNAVEIIWSSILLAVAANWGTSARVSVHSYSCLDHFKRDQVA